MYELIPLGAQIKEQLIQPEEVQGSFREEVTFQWGLERKLLQGLKVSLERWNGKRESIQQVEGSA